MWGDAWHVFWNFYFLSAGATMLVLLPNLLSDIGKAPTFWKRKVAFIWAILSLLLCLVWPIVLVLSFWADGKIKNER